MPINRYYVIASYVFFALPIFGLNVTYIEFCLPPNTYLREIL